MVSGHLWEMREWVWVLFITLIGSGWRMQLQGFLCLFTTLSMAAEAVGAPPAMVIWNGQSLHSGMCSLGGPFCWHIIFTLSQQFQWLLPRFLYVLCRKGGPWCLGLDSESLNLLTFDWQDMKQRFELGVGKLSKQLGGLSLEWASCPNSLVVECCVAVKLEKKGRSLVPFKTLQKKLRVVSPNLGIWWGWDGVGMRVGWGWQGVGMGVGRGGN